MPLPPLLPWRLATTVTRWPSLLCSKVKFQNRLSAGIRASTRSLVAWQQAPGIRLCSSKVPERAGEQGHGKSKETSPAIAEAKPAEVEASTAPSLADMSRDVSYRQFNSIIDDDILHG